MKFVNNVTMVVCALTMFINTCECNYQVFTPTDSSSEFDLMDLPTASVCKDGDGHDHLCPKNPFVCCNAV